MNEEIETSTEFDIDEFVDRIVQNNDLEEPFIKMVLQRLLNFGYTVNEEVDIFLIPYTIKKELNSIYNSCNIKELPEKLTEFFVDRVCGSILFQKKQANQLSLNNFDLEMAVKSLTLGDTSFTFDDNSLSDSAKLDLLINNLMNAGKDELVCYRKLKW